MALREINLVPSEILNRYHLRRHLLLWAGCLMVICALTAGFYFYDVNITFAESNASDDLKEASKKLPTKMNEIKELREKLDTLQQKKANFEKLNKGPTYSYILSRLVLSINRNTWLTQLRLDRQNLNGNRMLVRMNGFSSSNNALGDLLNRLSNESLFGSVLLKYAREISTTSDAADGPRGLIQFQIDCEIQEGGIS
jgi:Tfp pilus assembly protein PilN